MPQIVRSRRPFVLTYGTSRAVRVMQNFLHKLLHLPDKTDKEKLLSFENVSLDGVMPNNSRSSSNGTEIWHFFCEKLKSVMALLWISQSCMVLRFARGLMVAIHLFYGNEWLFM